jgi:predicted O-methyltransferase YrrM
MSVIFWFLNRPRYYPQLIRYLKSVFLDRDLPPTATREAATRWCEEYAVNTNEAVARITGESHNTPIRDKFRDIFTVCDEMAKSCPIRMGGLANIDLLYYVTEHLQAKRVVETGVSYGWSSLAFLLSLIKQPDALLVSVDMPYPIRNSDQYVGCIVPVELTSHWKIIRLADREGLPRALKMFDEVDICHYDSEKSYSSRMWAYPIMWKALRSGGYLISDDIGDNLGFYDFCLNLKVEPIIISTPRRNPKLKKYVGILIK